MLASRPSIHEKGREMATAPDPILETCPTMISSLGIHRHQREHYQRILILTSSCSRKQKYASMLMITRMGTFCQTL